MKSDIELLQTVCETADMGRDSINQVQGLIGDPALNASLKRQGQQYDLIYNSARRMLKDQGQMPKNSSPVAKVSARIQANLQTLVAENERSKIAEMVIQGSTMGVTKLTKQLHEGRGCSEAARGVAKELVLAQEANISDMKQFL